MGEEITTFFLLQLNYKAPQSFINEDVYDPQWCADVPICTKPSGFYGGEMSSSHKAARLFLL